MAGALGELNIDLSANIAKFESAMSKAAYLAETSMDKVGAAMKSAEAHAKLLEGALGALGTSLGALGVVAGAGAFVEMVKGSIETAAEMKHLSEQTGVSVSALSAMKGAAKLAGVDLHEAAQMTSKLDKAMWQAQGGSAQAQSSFEKLGVKVLEGNGRLRDTESVLMDVAKRFDAMESGAARTALAQELFGKTGSKMIPLLEQLAEKGNLQGRMTDRQAEAALHLEQSWMKMQASMNAWKFDAMEKIAPALERLIPVLPTLTAGVVGFLGAVKLVPMAIEGVTVAIRTMQAVTTMAGLTGMGVFAGLTSAVEAFTVAVMANPFGAIAVAILAAGTALYLFQDKMVEIGGTTASVGNWIGGVWDTIKDGALALWDAVVSIATTTVAALTTVATAIYDFYAGIYGGIWSFITSVFDRIAGIAQSTYESMTGWLKDAIDAIIAGLQKVYDAVGTLFGKVKSAAADLGAAIAAPINHAVATAKAAATDVWDDIRKHAAERAAAAAEHPEPHKSRIEAPINDGKGTGKKDPYDSEMHNLGRESAGLEFAIANWDKYAGKVRESKTAMAEFDLTLGKFSDTQRRLEGFSPLTAKQKADYAELMGRLEEEQRRVDQLNKLKSFNAKTVEIGDNREADLAKRTQELQLIGMSAVEAAHLKTILDEQEKAQQRINQALKDGVVLSEAERQAQLDSARSYAERINAVEDQKRQIQRDPVTGANNAFNGFVDAATNAGQQVQNALTGAFNGATDALTKFCEGGKVSFRSLAESIIQGLLKIAAQQAMGGLVGALGGALGIGGKDGGGLFSGLFGGGRASGGSVLPGSFYLVGEHGPELLAMGGNGTVVPNHQLRQAVGSGAVSSGANTYNGDVNVTVNQNGQSDASGGVPALRNLGAMLGNSVREILINERRPGGLLA